MTAGSPGGDGQDIWLVICHSADEAGAWAHERLSARLPGPVELVTAEELGCATGWEHRLDASGVVARAELEDGRRLDASRVRGTLNRLEWIWFDRVSQAVPGDRAYAGQELHALVTSWLAALSGPVLNPASPQGLAGALRRRSEWIALAARAGLDAGPLRLASGDGTGEEEPAAPGSGDRVVVVGDSVLGPPDAPDTVVDGCAELARMSGCGLLAADFDRDDRGGWLFRAAEPTFDLRAGGEPLVEALATALLTGMEGNRGPALRHTV